jgi:hypothetical protein
MKKLTRITETVNTGTGEVTTIEKTFTVSSKNSEEFYITFLSGMNAVCELARPSDIKVLSILCTKAVFNTGRVALTPKDRKEIIDKLGIKPQSFSNSINRLKTAGLLSGDRGEYIINPQHFWKGTTDERNKLLREKRIDLLFKYKIDETK